MPTPTSTTTGKVYLVGAGPGDPDLLTVKALRLIQTADLILYDNLVSEDIRAQFPDPQRARYVGKTRGSQVLPQNEINACMIQAALQGQTVCRLKGCDPFVFGRGGEEMIELKAAGVPVEVVPGVTAAVGCAAYAGIPLTYRNIAQAVTLVTGQATHHLDVQWRELARMEHTLVFYMGLAECATITRQLLGAGKDPNTPVALIEHGTTPRQRVVRGVLKRLPLLAKLYKVESPALIVIGDVAGFAAELNWFGNEVSALELSA